MPNRGRKFALSAAVSVLSLSLTLVGPATLANAETVAPTPAATSAAPQTVAGAQAALDAIEAEVGMLEERYVEAMLAQEAATKRAAALQADVAAQQAKVSALRKQAAVIARASFQNSGVDTTTQLFVSGDPDSFLQQITTVSKVDENMNGVLQQFQAQQANLTDLKRAADAETAKAADAVKSMADATAAAKIKADEQTAILNKLTEAQRAALAAAQASTVGTTPTTSATTSANSSSTSTSSYSGSTAASKAASYARAQVGKAYVWGAEGPNSFDCSGLMVAAYGSAGISIIHSANGLSGYGRSVSKSDLQVGDLIFWYSPIHHVGMYVGNGMMVHARNVNVGVVLQSVDSYIAMGAPYSGAVRIVG